jgi:cation diffusion facilitator CzcD-associated flavoprotein CzcO
MAGILSAIKLREAGIDDLAIYEKADRSAAPGARTPIPGIACDVPSHLYSYSFEPNPDWSHLFSPGDEIQAYFEHVAAKHGVDRAHPLRRGGDGHLEHRDGPLAPRTAEGHRGRADVVIAATGVLHHPRTPTSPASISFEGACFHSARWEPPWTSTGKRVGVVGTGSTAVQIVSAVVDRVAHLSLFQRTAQWILPMDNPPYPEEDRAGSAGARAPAPHPRRLRPDVRGRLRQRGGRRDSPQMAALEAACLENLESASPTPGCGSGCARLPRRLQAPGVSPDFYEAIQRPNAELVTERIERSSPPACAPPTACSTSSTCWCWPPGSGSTGSCARSR